MSKGSPREIRSLQLDAWWYAWPHPIDAETLQSCSRRWLSEKSPARQEPMPTALKDRLRARGSGLHFRLARNEGWLTTSGEQSAHHHHHRPNLSYPRHH